MAEGRNWHTTERIKNLRPLAMMGTNVYARIVRAAGVGRNIL
jgi:hypothetical protein